MPKLFLTDFHKIRWKGGTWATEETVRFGWFFEPRYVRVRVMVRVTVSWGAPYSAWEDIFTRCLFTDNNFATSAALAEVRAVY